jgi:hypothetical protein
LGRQQGFLARQFHAACQNRTASFLRKKLVALGLALPLATISPAFATSVQAPVAPDTSASTMTTHSATVSEYNSIFARVGPHSQIVFIDRDDITRRMAQMPRGLTRDIAMQKAVEDYILDRTGLRLPGDYTTVLAEGIAGGSGQALPVSYKKKDDSTDSVCIVTGQNPDVSAQSYQQRIMGLYQGAYDDLRAHPNLRALDPSVSQRFTDYHELGHCMDNTYIMAFLKDPESHHNLDREINLTHKAEIFAEVFAALMLARDGETDVAGKRADQRLVGMATNGYLLSQMAGWDQLEKYVGFIYALHEGLWDAQRNIDRVGHDRIKLMSPQQLADLAHQITEQDITNVNGTDHAITFLLEHKFNLNVWETLRHEFPHIEERYQIALRVRDHISQAFVRVFGTDIFDPQRPAHEQLARNISSSMLGRAVPDQDRIKSDTTRIANVLRTPNDRSGDPEMQIILNAAREKDRLRALLDNHRVTQDIRDQATIDLVLMPDAMRMAILDLRQANRTVLSMDNHVRVMGQPRPVGLSPG